MLKLNKLKLEKINHIKGSVASVIIGTVFECFLYT